MPESFEQHFTQKKEEEKGKSLEEIKEEKALALAKEIKEIQERMAKEGETIKDYQEIIKLAERIKGLYEAFESKKARERLEKLKETPLYDKEKKQWNWYMNENQELKNSDRYSESQLLGVLAEAVTGNLEGAKDILEKLKETPLYDKEKEQWNYYMNENQEFVYSSRYSESQLLGVLAEAVTGNLKGAKDMFKKLKETPLYDKEKEQWNWSMYENQELENSDRLSESQLLGVLAEAVTGNLKGAKDMFKKLKETPLYDKEKEQWNWWMNKNQELANSGRSSYPQLLGVLAEDVTGNLERAKKMLKELKETPLYDKEKEQWNYYMYENQKFVDSGCYSYSQLIGVLAEALEEKGKEFIEWLVGENKNEEQK